MDAPSRSRRDLLRAGAAAVATTGLAGCRFDNPDVPKGHLFVTNPTGNTHRVSLTVVQDPETAGRRLVHGTYRVPSTVVLRFREVLEQGHEYTIRAAIPGAGPTDDLRLQVGTCDENAPSGRTDVRIRVEPDALGIIRYGCDRTYPTVEDEYVDPSEYRVSEQGVTETASAHQAEQ